MQREQDFIEAKEVREMTNEGQDVLQDQDISGETPANITEEMVQIAEGLPVYIRKSRRVELEVLASKPREFARKLLLELIKPSELKKMTAVGRGTKQGVPREIREAILPKKNYLTKKFKFMKSAIHPLAQSFTHPLKHLSTYLVIHS